MKKDPVGIFYLGSDGIVHSFDGAYERNVVDAVGLSPSQIKQMVYRQEWSQRQRISSAALMGEKW